MPQSNAKPQWRVLGKDADGQNVFWSVDKLGILRASWATNAIGWSIERYIDEPQNIAGEDALIKRKIAWLRLCRRVTMWRRKRNGG